MGTIIKTKSATETINLGETIGKMLKAGDTLFLYGDIGSGKTTFIKGIAKALGIQEREVTSASFVIISEIKGKLPLYHIDLYRIEKPLELIEIGIDEYIKSEGITVVEWADRLIGWECSIKIYFKYVSENERIIMIKPEHFLNSINDLSYASKENWDNIKR